MVVKYQSLTHGKCKKGLTFTLYLCKGASTYLKKIVVEDVWRNFKNKPRHRQMGLEFDMNPATALLKMDNSTTGFESRGQQTVPPVM